MFSTNILDMLCICNQIELIPQKLIGTNQLVIIAPWVGSYLNNCRLPPNLEINLHK